MVKRLVRSTIDQMIKSRGYNKPKKTYQESRFPQEQYNLISATQEYTESKNILEIGCNKGLLINMFEGDGKFTVGLDISAHWQYHDAGRSALGVYSVDEVNAAQLPVFDTICLLSVHHQWVAARGNEIAKVIINEISKKASQSLFVEFAAIASKYAYDPNEYFIDNDEVSVVRYAKDWFAGAVPDRQIAYIGKCRELSGVEDYRFMLKAT